MLFAILLGYPYFFAVPYSVVVAHGVLGHGVQDRYYSFESCSQKLSQMAHSMSSFLADSGEAWSSRGRIHTRVSLSTEQRSDQIIFSLRRCPRRMMLVYGSISHFLILTSFHSSLFLITSFRSRALSPCSCLIITSRIQKIAATQLPLSISTLLPLLVL